jgi:hypothetical protein
MVAALLRWKLCALFLGYEVTKYRLPALELSSLVVIIHPTCDFPLSGLHINKLVSGWIIEDPI